MEEEWSRRLWPGTKDTQDPLDAVESRAGVSCPRMDGVHRADFNCQLKWAPGINHFIYKLQKD
jgi:hypothetical protein